MEEYQKRRQTLLSHMRSSSILVLCAASQKWRSQSVEYPFRQESNFYYLTGIKEPDAVLVLVKRADNTSQYIVFLKTYSSEEEIWNGSKLTLTEVCEQYGADVAYPLVDLEKMLAQLSLNKTVLYYAFDYQEKYDQTIIRMLKHLRQNKQQEEFPLEIQDPYPWIYEMRIRKSAMEIDLLRKATDISAKAHIRLMQYCKPGVLEYQMEAEFIHACYQAGCSALAYNSIVGGGKNACTLHYVKNDQKLEDSHLVLVDAGGEYEGYAADITRTYPINGKFSATQKALYEVVLRSQLAAIDLVRPGLYWNQLQERILQVLVEGLKDLGILRGEVNDLLSSKAYLPFYMHSSGHWLGLDVHDPGVYKKEQKWRTLEPNMVFTIEPGIYMRPHPDVDEKWWNMGIRVEDDIVVTDTGYEVLTAKVPKNISDIENIMRQ